MNRTWWVAGAATAGAVVLRLLGPRWEELPHRPTEVSGWLSADPSARVADLAGLAAWAVCAWLLLATVLCLATRLPGWLGRVAAVCARVVAPVALRRLMNVAVGVSIVTGVAAPAAMAAPRPAVVAAAASYSSVPPSPSSPAPGDPAPRLPDLDRAPSSAPAPQAVPVAAPGAGRVTPPAASAAPAADPGRLVLDPDGMVVVQRGDSLWSITSRALGGSATDDQICAAWPDWWAANRQVIGTDPNLLHPGQRLLPPASARP